jgi:NTP pyrophosphatase (non-canonical NTP hydrolase)
MRKRFKMKDEEVYKEALKKWGLKAQVGMFIEEVGEALTAINHYDRGRIPIEELIEEFVDVSIMANQMRHINKETFDKIYKQKFNRVKRKLGIEVET